MNLFLYSVANSHQETKLGRLHVDSLVNEENFFKFTGLLFRCNSRNTFNTIPIKLSNCFLINKLPFGLIRIKIFLERGWHT